MNAIKAKGQGAMEYLMTYGWAIAVVLAIGIGMWRMGVFSLGGNMPPTASGFTTIQPLLATCFLAGERDFIQRTSASSMRAPNTSPSHMVRLLPSEFSG